MMLMVDTSHAHSSIRFDSLCAYLWNFKYGQLSSQRSQAYSRCRLRLLRATFCRLASMSSLSPSYWPIARLPGLKSMDIEQLQGAGVKTTADLLHIAARGDRKQELAAQLNIKLERINRWVAMADLARVPAVGCEHCGLLLHSGIIDTRQLADAATPQLHRQVQRLHVATLRNTRACPTVSDVGLWIAQAKRLS